MKGFFKRAVAAGCLFLGYSGAFLLLHDRLGLTMPFYALPLMGAALALVAGRFPGKGRILAGAVGLMALLYGGWRLIPPGLGYAYLIPCAFLYYGVLRSGTAPPFGAFGENIWLLGIACHLVGLLISRMQGYGVYGLQRHWFMAYVPLCLLLLNGLAVRKGATPRGHGKLPATLTRRNQILCLLLVGISLLLANIRALWAGVLAALRGMAHAIYWVLGLLAGLMHTEEVASPPEAGGGPLEMLEAAGEPALFWVILEYVAMGVTALAMVIGLYFLLKKALPRLKALLARLLLRLRRLGESLSQDGQDELESLLPLGEWREAAIKGLRRARIRLTGPRRGRAMDERQRVRHAYVGILRRQREKIPWRTAREVLSALGAGDAMATIYEKARYSEKPILREEADFMEEAARKER